MKRTIDDCILEPSEFRVYNPHDGKWHEIPMVDYNIKKIATNYEGIKSLYITENHINKGYLSKVAIS